MRECKNGFINAYIQYSKPQESPTIFHTWTAISTIASILQRKCWMERGYYTLYPNLYIILVSASGVGNKTTAIRIGTEDILSKALPQIKIMRGAITVPALIDIMTQIVTTNPTGCAELTIFCEEFKVFSKGLYTDSGLIENLTKLYDCGTFEYITRGQGSIVVDKPCVNLIAGSTPEWLTTGAASDFIGGGFSSRIVPVSIVKREKTIAWPEKTKIEKDLEQQLIHDAIEVSKLSGPFFVSTEAKVYFKSWYDVREKYRLSDNRMDGYYSKKHDLVLKLAMILSASMNDDMLITDAHIQTALSLLEKIESTIPYAFQGVAWGEQAKFQDRVLTKIKELDIVPHSDLLQQFHFCMSGNDLKTIIQTLLDADYICWEKIYLNKIGRPRIVYKNKEARIKSGNCIEADCTNHGCEFRQKSK